MSISIFYIMQGAVMSVVRFLQHWYVDGFRWFAHQAGTLLHSLDYTLAIRVTLRNFFKPLYGDYTFVGRILGFIFRPLRIIVGIFIYGLVAVVFVGLYIAWAALPPYLIIRTITG